MRAKADVACTGEVRNEWCNAGEGERGQSREGGRGWMGAREAAWIRCAELQAKLHATHVKCDGREETRLG